MINTNIKDIFSLIDNLNDDYYSNSIGNAKGNGYLINNELYEALSTEKSINNSNLPHKGVYLIVFRVLNYESKTLVYNYIHYNELFIRCLILFILSINVLMLHTYKEPGHFLSFIDNNLL